MADWLPIHQAAANGRTDGRDLLLGVTAGRQVVGRWHPTLGRWVGADDQPIVTTPTHYQDLGPAAPPPAPPVLTSLDPDTAVIGVPPFTLHVHGTGFAPGAVIVFNGYTEPTTAVSDTELTTGVNMAVWTAPSVPLPVTVRNPDGTVSEALTFTFTAEGAASTSRAKTRTKPTAPDGD